LTQHAAKYRGSAADSQPQPGRGQPPAGLKPVDGGTDTPEAVVEENMAGAPVAYLVVRIGQFEGTRYPLGEEETLIGRNPTTDITLLDENVSREHAIIARDEATGAYVFEDLQTTNGSKINGKRVRSGELNPGDRLEVGQTEFELILEGSDKSSND
jgi:pSer/pThr/pTyr-binding forkhead associated (FHA) protein